MKCPICGDDSFAGPRCYHTPEEWKNWHQERLDEEFGPGSYIFVEPKDIDQAARANITGRHKKRPAPKGGPV